MKKASQAIPLPTPQTTGKVSLEETLAKRRSLRKLTGKALTQEMISQLLWSLQGVTDFAGHRATPSAGALYPLEIYLCVPDGLYHYDPVNNELNKKSEQDLRPALYKAALEQDSINQAPAIFVISAVYERTAMRYGAKRAERYVLLECGHATQNLLLQAVALGLGAVTVGAFNDVDIEKALGCSAGEHVIYLVPVGQAAETEA